MTQQAPVERRYSGRNKLENRAPEVIAAFAQGFTWSHMLEQFGCTPRALDNFRLRHLEEIEQARAKVAKAVEDFAIASKVFRIGELDHLYSEMRKELDETGLFVTEVEYTDEGDRKGRIETRDFKAAMVKELRGTLRQAAEELAQLPRPTVEVSEHKTYILQVVVDGHGNPPIG